MPTEVCALFDRPENYTGDASSQALEIADAAEDYVGV
jgi:hypothetical protein